MGAGIPTIIGFEAPARTPDVCNLSDAPGHAQSGERRYLENRRRIFSRRAIHDGEIGRWKSARKGAPAGGAQRLAALKVL
jgi:hypothetical protein